MSPTTVIDARRRGIGRGAAVPPRRRRCRRAGAAGGATAVTTGHGSAGDRRRRPAAPRQRPDGVRGPLPARGRPRTAAPRRSARSRRGLLLLVVVVLLIALAAYAGWWFGIGRYTSTPGRHQPAASPPRPRRSRQPGSSWRSPTRQFSETVHGRLGDQHRPGGRDRGSSRAAPSRRSSRGARSATRCPSCAASSSPRSRRSSRTATSRSARSTAVFDETVEKGVVMPRPRRRHRAAPAAPSTSGQQGPRADQDPRLHRQGADRAQAAARPSSASRSRSPRRTATTSPRGGVISQDPDGGQGLPRRHDRRSSSPRARCWSRCPTCAR